MVNNRYLKSRLKSNSSIPMASRYADFKTAEEIIERTILANNQRVMNWLNNGRTKGKLQLNYAGDGRTAIGRGYLRGERKSRPLYNAKVVLKKDGTPRGYYVLTSFPEL
ncbi:MAG: hypothetical protein DRI57_15130 [Deltaproteobacteria bacterium]|nr:MAG: hypothetical protein DRI57_15130 [Deltaproteobacteria bacterium]